jgi:hypothetical protein
MKKFIFFIVISLLIFITRTISESYDNIVVHQTINEMAAKQSNNLINVLSNLGFNNTLEDEVYGKKIYKWFRDGGKEEDIPLSRTYNHFHDPTKSWDQAGLDDYCLILRVTGDSSVLWAQNSDQKYTSNEGTVYDVGGTWSWPKARDYYYQALTSTDKTTREQNFADTFRALGQVMHLLADSSVPEHTRNNAHCTGWHYEKWCEQNSATLNTSATAIDYSITNNSLVSGLAPITNFWDTMPSPGYNLNPIGLSEYTNFNFLSRKTIFKNYTYPQKSDTVILNINAEDNKPDERVYLKSTTSDGQSINHLVSTGYLWAELTTTDPEGLDDSRFNLDDECFKDYASILVPKAVGYSAGLLNYFFRGKMEEVDPKEVKDGTGNITSIKMKIRNNTQSETMEKIKERHGVFVVSYKYKPLGSTVPVYGISNEVKLAESIPGGAESTTEYTFRFSNPILSNAQEIKYWLVYRGKLGNEEDAVVGKSFELKEKQPISILIASCAFDYEGDNLHYGIINIANNTVTENLYPLKVRGDNDYASLITAPDDNSGEAFVVDETTLFKINIETGEVLSSVSNTWGDNVSGIISKGNFIYLLIAQYPNTILHKLNRADLSEIGSVELTSSTWTWWPTSFIITDDNYIYVSLHNKIYKLDSNLSIINSIEKPYWYQVGLAYYGGYIYTTYWDGLYKYDTDFNFIAKLSNPLGDYFGESLKIDKDGEYIYIGDFQPTVKKIRLSDFSYVGVIDLTDYLFYQVWTMAYDKVKNLIIAGDGYYGLVTINLDTFTLENHVSTFKGSNNNNAWNSIDVAYK